MRKIITLCLNFALFTFLASPVMAFDLGSNLGSTVAVGTAVVNSSGSGKKVHREVVPDQYIIPKTPADIAVIGKAVTDYVFRNIPVSLYQISQFNYNGTQYAGNGRYFVSFSTSKGKLVLVAAALTEELDYFVLERVHVGTNSLFKVRWKQYKVMFQGPIPVGLWSEIGLN